MKSKILSLSALFTFALCTFSFAQVGREGALSSAEGTLARPSWATPERLRGRVDGATPVTIQVHLPLRNLEAAKAELDAVSDPDRPRYGQYLTSEEFESKYSPTAEDLALVRSYLQSEGFSITYEPRNRQFISARAAAADVERVFATRLAHYEVAGELRRAPMEPARIPATIASRVSAVLGLSTSRVKTTALVRSTQSSSQSNSFICANYYGQYFDTTDPPYGGGFLYPPPVQSCGLTPPRVRRAYDLDDAVNEGTNGRGVTIAIVDAWRSPTLVSDAQRFATTLDPKYPLLASQITFIDAPSGGDPILPVDVTWYYEQLLDVESVHTIATGANILYVGAATNGTDDMTAAVNLVVQDNLATIISNSWVSLEDPTDGHDVLDPILIQAALKGIGTYFASGDSGDNQQLVGSVVVGYPASSPYTTAVGGTSLYLDQNDHRVYETGWESGDSIPGAPGSTAAWTPPPPGLFFFGANGGPSQRYGQPNYQRNIVPPGLAGTSRTRVVPDVAMLADLDSGTQLGLTDPLLGVYVIYPDAGGTSLATPLFAGTMALAEQSAGHRLGFANPKLYRVAYKAFRDIRPTPTLQSITQPGAWQDTEDPPNLQVQRPDGTIAPHTLHSAPGFDNVTGLGVPAGEEFLESLGENH